MLHLLTFQPSFHRLSAIKDIRQSAENQATTVSALVAIRLLPNFLLSPFGGAVADQFDRRVSMIALDLLGAACALLFILAFECRSVPMIYFAAFLQECGTGLYEPSRTAIVPLLITSEDELLKATNLIGVAWSVIAAFGAAAGGFLVALVGIRGCYIVDSLTYTLSAVLMYYVPGKFDVSVENTESQLSLSHVSKMIADGVAYLRQSFFWPVVFLKAYAALLYGASDVLNVSLSERGSLAGRSTRLGLLFASIGVGCVLVPFANDNFVDMSHPRTLQRFSLCGIAFVAVGYIMMGIFTPFWMVCLSSAVRSMGSEYVWLSSTLLLQKFSSPEMLGRVTSIDYSAAVLAEALSAIAAGIIQDSVGLTAEQISLILGAVGVLFFIFWAIYDIRGGANWERKKKNWLRGRESRISED
jgi:MFS family permease